MDSLQFLEKNFASVEATIRAFDVKAQIVLATMALSYQPILLTFRQLDTSASLNLRLALLFCVFCGVALMFLRVLAPYAHRNARSEAARQNLFFVRESDKIAPQEYLDSLGKADLLAVYSAEVLTLHGIRTCKDRRFRQALLLLCLYFTIVLAYGLAIVLRLT